KIPADVRERYEKLQQNDLPEVAPGTDADEENEDDADEDDDATQLTDTVCAPPCVQWTSNASLKNASWTLAILRLRRNSVERVNLAWPAARRSFPLLSDRRDLQISISRLRREPFAIGPSRTGIFRKSRYTFDIGGLLAVATPQRVG